MEGFTVVNKIILAPMVRICTLPFRLLCLDHKADYIFTEEIIDKKLMNCEKIYNSVLETNDYIYTDGTLALRIHEKERKNLILQIGTSSPDTALKAALKAKDDVIGIDVNMGCPKHFSTHGNMGSSLLALPNLVKEILCCLRENFKDKIISCKIRLLPDKKSTLEFIDIIQSTGINFFTVHMRKKDETAKDKANWKALIDIKKHSKIPVIGNGDILCPNDIFKVKKLTGCDGIMVARGSIHNPNIFSDYKSILENQNDYSGEISDNDYEVINDEGSQEQESKKKKKTTNDEPEISKRLAKVLENKYKHVKIEILEIIKEYLRLCLSAGNSFKNSKYCILYILKTHKEYLKDFQKIQRTNNYEELFDIFGYKDYYLKFLSENPNVIQYIDGSFYKQKLPVKEKGDKKSIIKQNIEFLKEK